MNKKAFLIFPVHLFKNIKLLKNYETIYLIEEPRYFTDYSFHKLKLAYHRASMKYYESYLKKNKLNIKYIEFHEVNNDFYKSLSKKYEIEAYDPNDHSLELLLNIYKINLIQTQNFSISREDIISNLESFYNKKSKKFNFMNFYKFMRIKLNILISKNGAPEGGKWSFDEENRKAYPKKGGPIIPDLPKVQSSNIYIKEAISYVEKHFPKNYGSLDYFIYPITHEESQKWCINFCNNRFKYFGLYEDAILNSTINENNTKEKVINNSEFLFHSVLSPMMNIGLITDTEVLDIVLKYKKKVPLSAFEGFIRQVIGWRNYIYMIYITKYGNPEMSIINYYKYIGKMNFMKHKEKLPYKHFWEGSTGILPVDDAIKTIVKYSYVHHIQRLMVLGNFMLLLKINPNDVFKIFMEWTVDAYEWVMIGNVYGMNQHADGGIIMTRPYFSSSNYILSMSNYKSGKESDWCKIWDALYGSFIEKHSTYLKHNYSTARMVTFYIRKSQKEKDEHKKIVSNYLRLLKK